PPALVADIEVSQVVGFETVAAVGLNVDLEDLIEAVEEVDERGAQIGLERLEDGRRLDLEGLCLGPVDVEVELGAAVAESAREASEARIGISRLDELGGIPLQLGQAKASTVLDHHLEAARLAQPPDRRRNGDEDESFLDVAQLAVEAGDYPVLAQGGAPFL